MSEERRLPTPRGEARVVLDHAEQPIATLLVSHGAGNGIETRDLDALAQYLPAQGVSVIRLEQPWRVAGRRLATPPATLDEALVAVAEQLAVTTPLVLGGRSAGARSAARCAVQLGAAGCLCLAFPLHPPGRPEKSRLHELLGSGVPTLVVQGERDSMGRPEEFPDSVDLAVVPGGDHGLAVPVRGSVSPEEAMAIVVEATLEWIVREVVGSGTPRTPRE